jgi:hypothetical protein
MLAVLILGMFFLKAVQFNDLIFLKKILMAREEPVGEDEVEPVYIQKSAP